MEFMTFFPFFFCRWTWYFFPIIRWFSHRYFGYHIIPHKNRCQAWNSPWFSYIFLLKASNVWLYFSIFSYIFLYFPIHQRVLAVLLSVAAKKGHQLAFESWLDGRIRSPKPGLLPEQAGPVFHRDGWAEISIFIHFLAQRSCKFILFHLLDLKKRISNSTPMVQV